MSTDDITLDPSKLPRSQSGVFFCPEPCEVAGACRKLYSTATLTAATGQQLATGQGISIAAVQRDLDSRGLS